MLDCALISSDEAFRHLVLGLVRQPAAQARLVVDLPESAEELGSEELAKILGAGPSIVFLDLGGTVDGLGSLQAMSQEAPDIGYVVTGPKLSADNLLTVMRAGATEYLPRPLSRDETLEAFRRVRRRAKPSDTAAPMELGKLVTLFSAKGGTGVTTVATNLSVALARQTSKEVLLIDLAPSMGTAAINMGLQPRYTYVDVIQNFHRIDEELLTSFLEKHESGVSILASPLAPADSDSIGPEQVLALIRYCRRFFGFVVVDPGNSLNTTVNAVLMESEQQVLVLTPELPALRNLKRALDTVGRMNGKPPPMVVLNQFKEGLGLSAKDVEDGLRLGLAAVLAKDDRVIFESINLGRPAVLVGKSRFSKALLALSGKIAGPDRLPIRAPSLFSRFSSNRNKTKSSKKERD